MNLKKYINDNLLGFACLISLIPLLFYCLNYCFNDTFYLLSKDSNEWGNFGDYLGGTAGSILTILNTIILFRLTKVANEIQIQAVSIQSRQFIILPYIEQINLLCKEIDQNLENKEGVIKILKRLHNELITFENEVEMVFESKKKIFDVNSFKEELIISIDEYTRNGNYEQIDRIFNLKSELLKRINCFIIK
jgi:hypothetical protein